MRPDLCTSADTFATPASITRATQWIVEHCRREFHAARVTERHGAGTRIRVSHPPIRALHQPTSGYRVASDRVLVKDCCPSPGTRITIEYDGGYETIPPAVVTACARLAEAFDRNESPPQAVLDALAPYRLAP